MPQRPNTRIKIEDCVHKGLYLLHSRNLSFGVFNKAVMGFVGIRTKFKERFLDTEFFQ